MVIELTPSTIMSAPALGLPDLAKPFTLYVTEKDKWLWECCPRLWGRGTDPRLISCPDPWVDNVAAGWPGCLRAVATVALLVQKATKLTSGQDLIVKVPQEVNTLL